MVFYTIWPNKSQERLCMEPCEAGCKDYYPNPVSKGPKTLSLLKILLVSPSCRAIVLTKAEACGDGGSISKDRIADFAQFADINANCIKLGYYF